MKTITTIILSFFMGHLLLGQEYKINISSGKISLTDINRLNIVGYNGSEVILTTTKAEEGENEYEHEDEDGKPDRSAGLKMINARGETDNTGLGLHLSQDGDQVSITPISSNQKHRYILKIPKNVNVHYEHNTHNGSRLSIMNTESEVEVSVHYNRVEFDNVTGPLTVKAVYGKVEGVVGNTNNNLSLHSTYGLVDLAFPASSPADVIMKTTYGNMYTDFDINADKSGSKDCSWCKKTMIGEINGGGTEIYLSSTYSSVYFRKN